MKIAYFGIFCSVASYTISAISHRSDMKKNIFDAAMIRQPSMTTADLMRKLAERFPEGFTGRLSMRQKKPFERTFPAKRGKTHRRERVSMFSANSDKVKSIHL